MRSLIIAAMLAATVAPAASLAQSMPVAVSEAPSRFEQDRQAILAMAGDYRVRFDMRETIAFLPGYDPLAPKTSGGHEVIRVIEDSGDRISLQHMLVAEHDGETFVIKHWRQDWVYQPETVLTYYGPDQWTLTEVPAPQRAGAWSQTVWQTDDSPRYGGVGRWSYDNGVAQWESDVTLRPLARRDAVRHPDYDRYVGTNRHALTPTGWVHLQDNVKLGPVEGDGEGLAAFVHEDVVNTYTRFDGYEVAAADAYWAATRDYWAQVRAAWDEAIAASDGVHVDEEAEWGSVVSQRLMELADQVDDGEVDTATAAATARGLIRAATTETD